MSSQPNLILKTLNIVSWILFLGLCIKAGTLIFTLSFSLFINPIAAEVLYSGLDLSQLMAYDKWHYMSMVFLIIINWGLKAYLFYWIVKIFTIAKVLSPFTTEVKKLIVSIGFVALNIGVVSILSSAFNQWLTHKGIVLTNLWEYTNGGAEFLLTAAIVLTIAQVFKRGIAIESLNKLTI
ncbi:hypothetical protein [Paucihalobacter sp.]|uniref:hypothetical protein n=1 Tax=Paucihalobacter sp. TaxID=2850405 RepID=UPI002FE41D2B